MNGQKLILVCLGAIVASVAAVLVARLFGVNNAGVIGGAVAGAVSGAIGGAYVATQTRAKPGA